MSSQLSPLQTARNSHKKAQKSTKNEYQRATGEEINAKTQRRKDAKSRRRRDQCRTRALGLQDRTPLRPVRRLGRSPCRKGGERRGKLAAAVVIAAAILTFPFEALPLGAPGIDSGWQWVVNIASQQDWVFGRDVVFTYGPLGWMASPQDVGAHLLLANGFRIALQGLMVICGLMVLFRMKQPAQILAFAGLWTIAGVVGLRFEGFVVLVAATAMLTSLRTKVAWPAISASLIMGIVPFIKTSLGIATAATVVIGLALIWKDRGPKVPIMTVTVGGLTAAILAALMFPSVPVFRAWIGQALEVVDGYAAAASIIGPPHILITGVLLLAGVICGGLLLSRNRPTFGPAALILTPGLLITFRLAFVRQDGHQYLFVPFVIALLGVASLSASRRATLALLIAGLAVAVLGTASGALPFGPTSLPQIITLGHRGPSNIKRLVHFKETRSDLSAASEKNLSTLRLPASWTEQMAETPNGITVVPWELMYAPANNLPFQPLRSMQLYSAYTPKLDRLTAEGLSGPTAPDFVLDDFAPVGKRRALLDAPQTWRTLFLEYRLERSAQDRALLMLSKRSQPLEHKWQDLGTATLEVGGPGITVPPSPHLVFAEIDAPLNLLGRLNKAFFRVPLLMAVFHRVDGSSSWARLIPATATAGILVSHFPHDIDDYAGLWSGRGPVAVSRLQIAGPGEKNYARRFNIRWRELVTTASEGSRVTPHS